MRKCLEILLLVLPLTMGCVASMRQESDPLNHPANPNGPRAPTQAVPLALREDPLDSAPIVSPEATGSSPTTPAESIHHHASGDSPESATSGQGSSKEPTAPGLYTCPMHPDVLRSEPGACPKCGMQLVKKRRP